MLDGTFDALQQVDWWSTDGVGRFVVGGVLGAFAAAFLTGFRERSARRLARRASVADQFLSALITTLDSRLRATQEDSPADARLIVVSEMLRAEVRSVWWPKRKLIQRISDLEERVRFAQPAPALESIAEESATMLASWVQHPRRASRKPR